MTADQAAELHARLRFEVGRGPRPACTRRGLWVAAKIHLHSRRIRVIRQDHRTYVMDLALSWRLPDHRSPSSRR